VLETSSSTVSRPFVHQYLAGLGENLARNQLVVRATNRIVDGHQFGAVGKGRFDWMSWIIEAMPSIT